MSDEQRPQKASGVDEPGGSLFRSADGPTFPRKTDRVTAPSSSATPERGPGQPGSRPKSPSSTSTGAGKGSTSSTPGRSPESEAEKTLLRPAVPAGASPETLTPGADARPTEATNLGAARPPRQQASRRTRKARLRLTRVDPWSVMKVSFLFSIAFGIMMWVSTYVVWNVVESSGMFASINDTVNNVLGTGQSTFRLEDFVNQSRVLGFTALLAAVDIVLFTAIATLFSFLYNLAASVLGGLEVTLAED